ncbi:MAG: class I SAM-dependent methyltransferase [Deltaproteobacteria bacterium]|nr:class I SAM-dependent methyltransferase [Deltaproteobacteria bacterium]
MDIIQRTLTAWKLLSWRQLRLRIDHCPVCDRPRPILRLDHNEVSIRCLVCKSSIITMSLISVLNRLVKDLLEKSVYELSSRGPLFTYLSAHTRQLTVSEMFDDIEPGSMKDGVPCQNVEQLTFSDETFDVCTSTEVFEHVADDRKGFSEIYRVLKPGGWFVFTVPLRSDRQTMERARKIGPNHIAHLLPPEYHGDHLRGRRNVLAFRTYGTDIIDRLTGCGFETAAVHRPTHPLPFDFNPPVIAARKSVS